MNKILLILICSLSVSTIHSQQLSTEWENDLKKILHQFLSCRDQIDDLSPCNKFVSEALKSAYFVDDFYDKQKNRHMLANEIFEYLKSSPQWLLLGNAGDQEALRSAYRDANANKAVLAVLKGPAFGHVALVMPGNLSKSSSWGGLEVPNSASFFLNNPQKSYIGKHLGWAFKSIDKSKVLLYVRIY